MTRSEEREQAFVMLFEWAFQPELTIDELLSLSLDSDIIKSTEFSEILVRKTIENCEKIDEKISTYTKGWKISRLTKVALSILRLAVCEILYIEEIPKSVSINEAVELAKKYASKKDSSFINGVLGSIVRENEEN